MFFFGVFFSCVQVLTQFNVVLLNFLHLKCLLTAEGVPASDETV